MAKKKSSSSDDGVLLVAENRKARHDYEILETVEAGIVLLGAEVKSLREGHGNLRDSYVRAISGELYLVGCHILPYKFARSEELSPLRDRKLLVHKKEMEKLLTNVTRKGLTLIAIKLYFKDGKCKVLVAVGRGKKAHDKRDDLKKREAEREMERGFKARSK
ncbi:MAG: SsrA-binding protein SmpB [Deltaproteobacteria bacterium]|nr:SsrA-binding protein SmpB [Deltaproteobacteria bacterium]